MTKEQQYNLLINSLRKSIYINEQKLSTEQLKELLLTKTQIVDKLENLKYSDNVLNENEYDDIQQILNKYKNFIFEEYYK